jgi:hypothetical protein
MKKNLINEHDYTKLMIDAIRNSKKNIIKEETQLDINDESNNETPNNSAEIDYNAEPHDEGKDVITPSENDPNYVEELKKIKDTIDSRVQITKFKIYPRDSDVEIECRSFTGLNFYFSLKEKNAIISITDNNSEPVKIPLDSNLLDMMKRVDGYFQNFIKEWSTKLTNEYKIK